MNFLLQYLIQSSVCLAAFYLVYRLFLRGETFFRLNRFYLLFASVGSMLIPLFRPDLYVIKPIQSLAYLLDPVIITPEKIGVAASSPQFNWAGPAVVVYLAGLIVFGILFISRLVFFLFLIRRNEHVRKHDLNLVVVGKSCAPFSFLNFIFVDHETDGSVDLNTILQHEKEHIRQFHTADLILLEIVRIVLWFNPFAWMILHSLKSEHEYLADEGVIQSGIGSEDYSTILVSRTIGKPMFAISNNFNVSLLKKRIIMMTKTRSRKLAKLKVFFALPVIFSILFFFPAGSVNLLNGQNPGGSGTASMGQQKKTDSPKESVKSANDQGGNEKTSSAPVSKQGDKDNVFTVVEKMPSYPGGIDKMIQFLSMNIKYPEDAKAKGIEGTVFVTFIVKDDGTVSNVKILRGIDKSCDMEAIRVVKMMPKWIPGEQKGEKVNVAYSLPVKYKLDKDKEKKQEKK